VRNGDQVLYIKKDAFRRTQLSFKAINLQGAAILCLPNPSGGNGWRANPWFVVQADPLKLLGQVSRVVDIDGDETEELVVVDDIWESYWPLFGHAGAPGASVFYRVLDGALVVDKQATETWASREIAELDAQIQEAHSKATSGVPLSTILTKFLYYRARNHEDIGWDELR